MIYRYRVPVSTTYFFPANIFEALALHPPSKPSPSVRSTLTSAGEDTTRMHRMWYKMRAPKEERNVPRPIDFASDMGSSRFLWFIYIYIYSYVDFAGLYRCSGQNGQLHPDPNGFWNLVVPGINVRHDDLTHNPMKDLQLLSYVAMNDHGETLVDGSAPGGFEMLPRRDLCPRPVLQDQPETHPARNCGGQQWWMRGSWGNHGNLDESLASLAHKRCADRKYR